MLGQSGSPTDGSDFRPARCDAFAGTAHSNARFLGKWLLLAFMLESLMVAYVPGDFIAHVAGTVTDGMRRHVERELARARAGSWARSSLIAVRPPLEQVLGVLRRTPRGHDLGWWIEVADDLGARIDAQDMAEILGNLTENAAKWATAKVGIAGVREGDTVVFSVEDDGPGVLENQIETVLARGGRLDETQPGSGWVSPS